MNIDIEPIIEDSESVAPEGTVPEPESSGFSPVLDEQPFPAEPEVSPETYRPIISLKHVDIYQKDILILSDVNLTVEKGELVYLVGKTGCGKSSLLKLYSSDVGLLTKQYGDSIRYGILMKNPQINLGGIFENFVAQELNSHKFDGYFYNSHKQGELDFVIENEGRVIPIEVKSGKDYYIHSALNNAVQNKEYQIDKAYVFADCNTRVDEKIRYMPIYMVSFLTQNIEMPVLKPIE